MTDQTTVSGSDAGRQDEQPDSFHRALSTTQAVQGLDSADVALPQPIPCGSCNTRWLCEERGCMDKARSEPAPIVSAYSERLRCKSCENGTRPDGCTDCLGKGLDPAAFVGGIEAALNDAYAEGRKDERKDRSRAALDVLAERERQKAVEGWTLEHDDAHDGGQMATAAAAYVLDASAQVGGMMPAAPNDIPPGWWPWDDAWWKPKDARRNLVRAAALILAEIERLDRATTPGATT